MDRFFVEHADKGSSPDETSPVEEKALRRSGILLAAVGALLIVLSAFTSTSFDTIFYKGVAFVRACIDLIPGLQPSSLC